MERKEIEDSLGRAAKPLKQEPLSPECIYSSFARDKENSEPMDISSPPPTSATAPNEQPHDPPPLLSTATGSSTETKLPSYTNTPVQKGATGRSVTTGATPDVGRSAIGTPQSLSQIINSSNFSFDISAGELHSPVGGSGFISPGSTKLGKKRPLSISPLSSSSINIDALVRSSPTSLINFITAQSRNSSAGSFGHLSPSLYATPSNNHNTFNRPAISLSKAVHPSLNHVTQQHSAVVPSSIGHDASQPSLNSQERSELADIADNSVSIQPLMKASLEQESEGELSIPLTEPSQQSSNLSESASENESKPFQRHGRRIYYAYPAVEEPHNNCCMWEGCQQQCESLDQLVMHVNSEHIYQESRKEFVCCWSGCVRERRPFKAQYMLLVHMRRHTGEKPHRCHYQGCEKAYSRLENLKTHLRSHTGEKPYLCKYEGCGKAFSNASDCAKHMNRTHSDEKPYGCLNPGCMKRYTDPSSRRKHMKNCQVNKKARTGVCDGSVVIECEESIMDTACLPSQVAPIDTTSKKAAGRPKKSDKKRKEESKNAQHHQQLIADHFPTSQMDLGYMSGESQCTPNSLMSIMKGRTQLSGYNSSGYDTEYPSLPEDHSIPPLVMNTSESDHYYDNCIVKQEQFSPSSQMEHYPYQLSQPPPPPYTTTTTTSYKNTLQPLPELYQAPHYNQYAGPFHGLEASHSSGYSSSFGSSQMHDDCSSIYNSVGGQRTLKGGAANSSDLSNGSHSSFSTLSSRLSSPLSDRRGSVRDFSKHSYRNLRPPDLILRPQQPSYSVQMSDIKTTPLNYMRRQSDEVSSIRSSHSSRYSGSEYSDDMSRIAPPLPHPDTHSMTRGEPLPLPQSMQPDFMTQVAMTTDPQSIQYMSKEASPSHAPYMYNNNNNNTMPLKHFEPLHKGPSVLPMIYESHDTSNMVIGNLSMNASQLQQDNLLLETLSASHPYI